MKTQLCAKKHIITITSLLLQQSCKRHAATTISLHKFILQQDHHSKNYNLPQEKNGKLRNAKIHLA
ncbi:MAG: hypothetical protein GY816_18735 [Cytophagales bacterium]|nr:hypothetical protein [Cytophagales bacterium]